MLCGDLFASPCLVLKLVYNGNCLLSWSLQELQKMIESKEEDLRRCKDLQVSEFKDATQELQQNFAKVNIVYHYTRQNAQVVTNLQQTCIAMLFQQLVIRMCSHCLLTGCQRLVDTEIATRLLSSTVTNCYKLFQQLVIVLARQIANNSLVTTWYNNSIVTTFCQTFYKPVANTSR